MTLLTREDLCALRALASASRRKEERLAVSSADEVPGAGSDHFPQPTQMRETSRRAYDHNVPYNRIIIIISHFNKSYNAQ